jgi:hypothetical protein
MQPQIEQEIIPVFDASRFAVIDASLFAGRDTLRRTEQARLRGSSLRAIATSVAEGHV